MIKFEKFEIGDSKIYFSDGRHEWCLTTADTDDLKSYTLQEYDEKFGGYKNCYSRTHEPPCDGWAIMDYIMPNDKSKFKTLAKRLVKKISRLG